MEHRWSPRKTVEHPVHISHRGHHVGAGLIRNASRDGLFIESDEEVFSRGLMLDLVSEDATHEDIIQFKVYVVRIATGGAGAICVGECPLPYIE